MARSRSFRLTYSMAARRRRRIAQLVLALLGVLVLGCGGEATTRVDVGLEGNQVADDEEVALMQELVRGAFDRNNVGFEVQLTQAPRCTADGVSSGVITLDRTSRAAKAIDGKGLATIFHDENVFIGMPALESDAKWQMVRRSEYSALMENIRPGDSGWVDLVGSPIEALDSRHLSALSDPIGIIRLLPELDAGVSTEPVDAGEKAFDLILRVNVDATAASELVKHSDDRLPSGSANSVGVDDSDDAIPRTVTLYAGADRQLKRADVEFEQLGALRDHYTVSLVFHQDVDPIKIPSDVELTPIDAIASMWDGLLDEEGTPGDESAEASGLSAGNRCLGDGDAEVPGLDPAAIADLQQRHAACIEKESQIEQCLERSLEAVLAKQ